MRLRGAVAVDFVVDRGAGAGIVALLLSLALRGGGDFDKVRRDGYGCLIGVFGTLFLLSFS